MIGVYFFLPTPAIPPHQRDAYIQKKLASGNTVITAVEFAPFREESKDICYDCTDLMIHWRLVNRGRNVMLHFSESSGSVNMTKALELARDWNHERWKSRSEQKWTPYFSVPMTMNGIPGGSLGEEIAMPWFHDVDQKLIDYNMHNAQASVFVRAVVPEPGIVQIWRSKYVDWALKTTVESARSSDDDFLRTPEKSPAQVSYEQMMLYKQETDFLASFHLVESWENTLVVMEHLAGELPSRTYTIRRALLVPLGPFVAIPFIMANELYEVMPPFLWFVLVMLGLIFAVIFYPKMLETGNIPSLSRLCWPLRVFRRRRKQQSARKQVWGPTGPVDMGKEDSLFDEESEIGLRRPDTARLHSR